MSRDSLCGPRAGNRRYRLSRNPIPLNKWVVLATLLGVLLVMGRVTLEYARPPRSLAASLGAAQPRGVQVVCLCVWWGVVVAGRYHLGVCPNVDSRNHMQAIFWRSHGGPARL